MARPLAGAGLSVFGTVNVTRTTKGSIEAEIANAVVRFHREQQGRGPTDVKASLIGDLILVRCAGIFTATEARLTSTDDGRKIIKSARQELRSINHSEIEGIIGNIVGAAVVRSYFDLDVNSSEQIEVFVLDIDIEKRLLRQELDNLNSLAPRRNS